MCSGHGSRGRGRSHATSEEGAGVRPGPAADEILRAHPSSMTPWQAPSHARDRRRRLARRVSTAVSRVARIGWSDLHATTDARLRRATRERDNARSNGMDERLATRARKGSSPPGGGGCGRAVGREGGKGHRMPPVTREDRSHASAPAITVAPGETLHTTMGMTPPMWRQFSCQHVSKRLKRALRIDAGGPSPKSVASTGGCRCAARARRDDEE
jgi:hypothetical protein